MAIIKSKAAYREESARYEQIQNEVVQQYTLLAEEGFSDEEIVRMLEPLESRLAELRDQITFFQRLENRDLTVLKDLSEGQVLIAMRLVKGLSQRQLADMLGVDQSQVSRDEANEYRTATLERLRKVAEVLDLKVDIVPRSNVRRRSNLERAASASSEGTVRFEVIPPAAPLGIALDELPPPSWEDRQALRRAAVGA